MYKRLKIFIDMDETINNLVQAILPLYNAKYGDDLKFENITDYSISQFLKPECENIWKDFTTDEFMMSLEMPLYARETLIWLCERHEVYFLTSCHPETVPARHNWLQKHLGDSYTFTQLIMCSNKHLIHGDVLIEDCIDNTSSSFKHNLILEKPYTLNKKLPSHCELIHSWRDIKNKILVIERESLNG